MSKPELMLPAGKPEAFWAALEGGADAVYLGLKKFNARNRALNFTFPQLQAAISEAHRRGKKVYLTLNTVILNKELPELVSILYRLNQTGVDGVIIQDWGVYHLIRSRFQHLSIHASTQMGNHNSIGARFSEQSGFERIICARELTPDELAAIRKKSRVQMEIFVHGALCYSMSGFCLFSSYLGGFSANRGTCRQPCRRNFKTQEGTKFLFSLKDNQLIGHIPGIIRMGIDALKIEGRIRSAEYVYTAARAYRMAIDFPERTEEAKGLLEQDMGREKTAYFFGQAIGDAMTETPAAGEFLGVVVSVLSDGFYLQTNRSLEKGYRIRINSPEDEPRLALTISRIERQDDKYFIGHSGPFPKPGDSAYLAASGKKRFPAGLKSGTRQVRTIPHAEIRKLLSGFRQNASKGPPVLYLRIDSLNWLEKIKFEGIDRCILKLSMSEWEGLNPDLPLFQRWRKKWIFEFPKFIPESGLSRYQHLCKKMADHGLDQFMLGHLSQKLILPKHAGAFTSENVYVFNDAAAAFLKQQKISGFVYPFENDIDNLFRGGNRSGIVPLYYFPELFYSRMPVTQIKRDESFTDISSHAYKKKIQDGITTIIPAQPVALFHYRDRLIRSGYRSFLIDLSYARPSLRLFRELLDHYQKADRYSPSVLFNFKKGLK